MLQQEALCTLGGPEESPGKMAKSQLTWADLAQSLNVCAPD
jgi:hypothetical protein